MERVFSKRLRQLRIEKGVSAKHMSRELGMTENYIYNIEAGYAYPSMTQFFSICTYLDIAPAKFLVFEPETSAKEDELLEAVDGFDNERIQQIIEYAKGIR